MRTTAAILVCAIACCVWRPAYPQAGQLRALAVRYQEDLEGLRGYEWKSRTEITVGGETRELALFRVRLDADGELERTPLKDERRKDRKAAEFIEDLRRLVRSYTRFTPEEMYTVFDDAKMFPEEGEGESLLRFQVRGVVRPGDRMYMWAEAFSHRLRKIEISTSLDGQPVHVVTEYRDLENGPTYAARMTVKTELKRKSTLFTTESFDHVSRGE